MLVILVRPQIRRIEEKSSARQQAAFLVGRILGTRSGEVGRHARRRDEDRRSGSPLDRLAGVLRDRHDGGRPGESFLEADLPCLQRPRVEELGMELMLQIGDEEHLSSKWEVDGLYGGVTSEEHVDTRGSRYPAQLV